MNLLVFGATGATGQQVMEQALARGHQVTAVARRPEAIIFASPHLRVVRGDVTELTSFQHHLAGQDVVVAALGTRGSAAATTLYSVGAANVLQAMQQHGVRRLLTVTAGAYVQDETDPPLVRLVVKPLLTTVLGAVYEDMQRMEKLVRASSLNGQADPTRSGGGAAGRVHRAGQADQPERLVGSGR
jgi:putative NADH-flavin reductase